MPGKAERSTLVLGTEDGTFHFSYEKYPDFKTQDQIAPHPADFNPGEMVVLSLRPGCCLTASLDDSEAALLSQCSLSITLVGCWFFDHCTSHCSRRRVNFGLWMTFL